MDAPSRSPASRPSRSSSTARRRSTSSRRSPPRRPGNGAQLLVFPETFVPAYPSSVWAQRARRLGRAGSEGGVRAARAGVGGGSRPRPTGSARRRERHGVWIVTGVNEIDPERPATIYNTLLYHAPDGTLALKHRKLVPTNHERLIWGQGDGGGLRAIADRRSAGSAA